jgi:hypothetical protein
MAGDILVSTTPLQAAAVSMHEAFTELCRAGFTERQALIYLAESTRKPSGA